MERRERVRRRESGLKRRARGAKESKLWRKRAKGREGKQNVEGEQKMKKESRRLRREQKVRNERVSGSQGWSPTGQQKRIAQGEQREAHLDCSVGRTRQILRTPS